MAKRLLTTLRLLNLDSDPASGSNGDIYYNSSSHKTKIYTNGQWKSLPSNIDDLDDVGIFSATDGQLLAYNSASGLWTNVSASAASGGISASSGIAEPVGSAGSGDLYYQFSSDSLRIRQVFVYIGSNWVHFPTDIVTWNDVSEYKWSSLPPDTWNTFANP